MVLRKRLALLVLSIVFLSAVVENVHVFIRLGAAMDPDHDPSISDLNHDGVVNMLDIAIVAMACLSYSGHPRWNPNADLNRDGYVNILDLVMVAKNYGLKSLHYDFNDLSDWLVISGTWHAENSSLEGSSEREGLVHARDVVNIRSTDPIILTARVKIAVDSPVQEAAICFCLGDQENLYWAGIGCWGHRVSISRKIDGISEELVYDGDVGEVSRDVWYTLSVKVYATDIALYVNDQLQLEITDSTFTRGAVGIRSYDSHVVVDYVEIWMRPAPKQPSNSVSWLYTSEMSILDESQQEVNLHCINLFYGGGEGIALSDLASVKTLGFNAFRIHVYWGLIQPYDEMLTGTDERYFTSGKAPLNHGLDELVDWAIEQNMYFIIDLCWTRTWSPPSWAFSNLANDVQRYEALIKGTASKERTGIVNVWKYIANRYRDVPNVIFELLNEPAVSDIVVAGDQYKAFNEEVISAIESVEANSHPKIMELLCATGSGEEILNTAVDVDKPNVLWATHRYTPLNDWNPTGTYYHGSFTWHGQHFPSGWGNGTTYVAWRIIRCAEKIHSWNKPWINTEFGKVVTQVNWKDWFQVVLDTKAEYNAVGWGLWCYCSNPNTARDWNINNPTTQRMIMDEIRPYMA